MPRGRKLTLLEPGPELGDPAISAAHGALLEVASLLKGRAPTSEVELGYIDKRAAAVADRADCHVISFATVR